MNDVLQEDIATEAAAHAVLRLVADRPGRVGRIRAARVVGGRPVSTPSSGDGAVHETDARAGALDADDLSAYAVAHPWRLADLCGLVDALIEGGMLDRTVGMRPTLVLTRAGFRALEALERSSP